MYEGALLNQVIDHFRMTLAHGDVQRCAVVVVAKFDVSALSKISP